MKLEAAWVAEVDGYWNVYARAHGIRLTEKCQKTSVDFFSHIYCGMIVDELLVQTISQIH
jgi:hypothetical protein